MVFCFPSSSEALHFFQTQSLTYFLFGTEWSPDTAFLEGAGRADASAAQAKFGAVPIFAGTFYITIMAMILAIPVGLLSAIFMSEYATPKLRSQLKPFLEILAGIPTVVYGFFAALTIAPAIVKFFGLFWHRSPIPKCSFKWYYHGGHDYPFYLFTFR